MSEEFPKHIQALDDYGYAPPKPGNQCGQCGIDWSAYEAKLAEKEAEIERLKNSHEACELGDMKEIERLKAQLQKAKEALKEYGNHNFPGCDIYADPPKETKCTCGFEEASK